MSESDWRQFVILEHSWRGVHWDLMFHRGAALATWAVDEPPILGCELIARQLPDHRTFYLKHEGEVSGGRGSVRCWARGCYRVRRWSDDQVELELRGDHWEGRLLMEGEVVSDSSASAGVTDSTGGPSSPTSPWRIRLRRLD